MSAAERARLFHLVRPAEWRAQRDGAGRYAPPSLAREGFVHLSFAAQLAGTLDAHFAAPGALWLLELEPRRLADALVLERSRGGALFPHLRRALEEADCLRWWALAERVAPLLGASAGDDRPPGRAGAPQLD